MRLTSLHLDALRAMNRGDITVTSAGFELEGQPITDEAEKASLDHLWLNDYIDADFTNPDEAAPAFLTDHGRQALAKAEQEITR